MSPNRVKDLVPWVVTIAAMAAAGSGQLSAFAPAPRQARGDDGLGLSRKHAYFLSLAESFARVRDRFPPTPRFGLLPGAAEVALSADEFSAIRDYNNARAAFAFARGALLERSGVRAGGRLLLAAEERERTLERVRKEKPLVLDDFPRPDAVSAPTLAALWKEIPPLREAKPLPGPEEFDSSGPRLEPYGPDDLFPPVPRPSPKEAGAGK